MLAGVEGVLARAEDVLTEADVLLAGAAARALLRRPARPAPSVVPAVPSVIIPVMASLEHGTSTYQVLEADQARPPTDLRLTLPSLLHAKFPSWPCISPGFVTDPSAELSRSQ